MILDLPIVYHNEGILVVDKAFGIPSQPTQNRREPDVYSQLCQHFPYVGMHHRLDQTASGLLLFTTDANINQAIAESFKTHQIKRSYLAWVTGNPTSGSWNQDLDGKSAHTDFHTLYTEDNLSLIQLHLQTGRTHQIRLHCSMNGHPIIGDHRYGQGAKNIWPRLALHAHHLEFQHPKTHNAISLFSPIPSDLEDIFFDMPDITTFKESFYFSSSI